MYNNCIHCGKFKRLNRLQACQECHRIDENYLGRAKAIMKRMGRLSPFEMADEIGVEPDRIFLWMQQGRMKQTEFKYACPVCGKDLIRAFCDCQIDSYVKATLEEEAAAVHAAKPKEVFHTTSRAEKIRQYYWTYVSGIKRKQKRDIWVPQSV